MPDQFTVPQFIDAEDKIIGPITVRQFLILLVAALLIALFWKLLSFIIFVFSSIFILGLAFTLAFAKINGMPFHFFLLNLIQTLRKPRLRVWDKWLTDSQLRIFLDTDIPEIPTSHPHKPSMATSHLEELTLVVNTGGAYKPEESID
ncbi:hypothetical protein CO172_02060 [Candidatus Uhrbacteria bacterium CG_4_9_14_3_um_filter_36_7]|uniref:PrgI family protein n=1 Tax=Candidatus Uhrbacteria bacterium CG_4_9_14_3_um_filter_36_7 TaxID=1975033 RepID=A0A2M7XHI7_9BACT|nr:MAG: hypothetical protein CO172_02060 [Candidatus Uhrbacteria bacterium CG_4_9_14_3_um_filter_36_7]